MLYAGIMVIGEYIGVIYFVSITLALIAGKIAKVRELGSEKSIFIRTLIIYYVLVVCIIFINQPRYTYEEVFKKLSTDETIVGTVLTSQEIKEEGISQLTIKSIMTEERYNLLIDEGYLYYAERQDESIHKYLYDLRTERFVELDKK